MIFPWVSTAVTSLLSVVETVPPVVLVCGEPGIGKTEMARWFCMSLLCERRRASGLQSGLGSGLGPGLGSGLGPGSGLGLGCGQCDACQWFLANNHPDFRGLVPAADDAENSKADASKEIRIQQIREIAGFVNTSAHRAGRRVVLIDPADALNVISANALLKTLEEPTESMHVVLVTARPQRLPATLRSRCFRFVMPSPTPHQAAQWLAAELKISDAEARLALAASGNSVKLALGYADPSLRAAQQTVLEQLAALPDTESALVADRISSIDPKLWLPLLQRWLADLGRVVAGAAPQAFPGRLARLQQLAKRTHLPALVAAARLIDRQSALLSRPLNARLYCESILFDYQTAFASKA